jgi:drug/metabolite transporter (DMT)-like permease
VVGLPMLVLYAVAEREVPVIWNGAFVGLLLFLSLVGTALVTFLWYWIVAREDVGRLSMFLFLVPVFGMGISALVFREKVSVLEGIGLALIVAGVGAAALAYERKGVFIQFDKKRQIRE